VILYRATELDIETTRVHPWVVAEHDSSCRYVDFRREPEKIESSLEDYRYWNKEPAIHRFYELIRWLNSSESHFETNDCALRIVPNKDKLRPYALQASGRIMLFVSELKITCMATFIDWFMEAFEFYLRRAEPHHGAAVGISKARCYYETVGAHSHELVLNFWGWGDSECSAIARLEGVFDRIGSASQKVNLDVEDILVKLSDRPDAPV
jgi:hypothetical protein